MAKQGRQDPIGAVGATRDPGGPWLTARYESGALRLQLRVTRPYGEGGAVTPAVEIPQDDEDLARIARACERLVGRYTDELERAAELARARALVADADSGMRVGGSIAPRGDADGR